MTDNELNAALFLAGAFIEGRPAEPAHVAQALAILARNRPFAALGRVFFLAMVEANLGRAVNREGNEQ